MHTVGKQNCLASLYMYYIIIIFLKSVIKIDTILNVINVMFKKNAWQTPKIHQNKRPTWDFLVIFQCLVNLINLTIHESSSTLFPGWRCWIGNVCKYCKCHGNKHL